jgi:organic radical activating enzyme
MSIKKFIKMIIPSKVFTLYHKMIDEYNRTHPRQLLKFEVHLTEHCNLNCKMCSHFSPLAKNEFVDVKNFARDFERLSELTNGGKKIYLINLLGGEPLLHKNLVELLNIARRFFPYNTINLVTNGILLEKQQDDFWKSCKDNKITLCISKYPIKLAKDEIKRIAEVYGINCEYWGGDNGLDDEIKTMHHMAIDINGKNNFKKSFKHCPEANGCVQLVNGRLYTCCIIPYIRHFNEYFHQNLVVNTMDYIDIYEAKNLDEILEFLCQPVPFCRYCNIEKKGYGFEWGISKKEITEWIIK